MNSLAGLGGVFWGGIQPLTARFRPPILSDLSVLYRLIVACFEALDVNAALTSHQ